MRSPLNKRLFRELRGEFGKYLVIFILMTLTIGMVSGFLVADGSMIQAYEESFEKYNIENGHFRTEKKMNNAQIQDIEDLGIKLYENYYVEEALTNGSTMRIFKNRDEVNKVCLMKGKMPEKPGEIGDGCGALFIVAIPKSTDYNNKYARRNVCKGGALWEP